MEAAILLKNARRKAGLTQRELATRVGVPQSGVARIESGGVVPRVDTLGRLLRGCGQALAVEPLLGIGIDRTVMRELRRLTPQQRLDRAVVEAEKLKQLEGIHG